MSPWGWARRPAVRLVCAVVAASVVLGLVAPPDASAQSAMTEFSDLRGHWSESFVRTLLYAGVLTVPQDGRFRPDEPVTRLDFTLWIAGAMELQPAQTPPAPPFTDWARIPEDARGKVLAAVQAGLINGFPDGSFRPNEPLTRAQMGVIFGRALTPLGFTPEDRYRHTFVDGDQIPAWAADATAAIKARVILGTWRNGRVLFAPFDFTTRAEAVTMIVRFAEIRFERLGIERPQPVPIRQGLSRVAYYMNTDAAYDSLVRFGDRLDAVIYASYALAGPDGSIKGYDSPRTLSWAVEKGKPLIALIAAHDRATNDAFLRDARAQDRFVSELKALLDKGYSGVNLDFEYVPAVHRETFTALVRRVASELRALGAHVSISVPAKTRENLSSDWVGAFDYAAIGQVVDYVAIMTYDQHWRGGPPGPIGSLGWMRSVLDYAVQHIPRKKILLGIPAYGYDWPQAGGTAQSVTSRQASALAAGLGITPAFDPATGEASFTYTDAAGQRRIVYFTPPAGVALKVRLAAEYGLAGFVMWRLGQEHEGYWDAFREALP